MIDGKLRTPRLLATVLASISITREHAPPRAGQSQAARNANIARQTDDKRNCERFTQRTQALLSGLNHLGFILKKQDNRPTGRNELKWLVAGIEDENALSQGLPPFQKLYDLRTRSRKGDRPQYQSVIRNTSAALAVSNTLVHTT